MDPPRKNHTAEDQTDQFSDEDEDWASTKWADPIASGIGHKMSGQRASNQESGPPIVVMESQVYNTQNKHSDYDLTFSTQTMREEQTETDTRDNTSKNETAITSYETRRDTASITCTDASDLTSIKTTVLASMEKSSSATAALNTHKAGMDGLDKDRVKQIIHNASKGSKFYENERKKEANINERIARQRKHVEVLSEADLAFSLVKADSLLEELELCRDMSRDIVHIDMDAFYAAVETRDNPALRDIPMAVGGNSMLSTSNYHARKFGVRAGMPGFIAKKLCPHLTIVSTNFDKYQDVSAKVKVVMADYDPNFCPMSLDEAYLDFTEHLCKRRGFGWSDLTYICRDGDRFDAATCQCDPNDKIRDKVLGSVDFGALGITGNQDGEVLYEASVESDVYQAGVCSLCERREGGYKMVVFGRGVEGAVRECRSRVEQKTQLTASAGISCNMLLAKVCSDYNKPNGQFRLPSNRDDILKFISPLPIRKVGGIGKVSEHMLTALGIETCHDLYVKRSILYHLYSDISFHYFMRTCLGLGTTRVAREGERKSKSVERTFSDTKDPVELLKKLRDLSESLAEDLEDEGILGKTIGIKLKTDKFILKTKARTVKHPTRDADTIYTNARSLLQKEMVSMLPDVLCLRLMGVRMSGLVSDADVEKTNKRTIVDMLKNVDAKFTQTRGGCDDVEIVSETQICEKKLPDCEMINTNMTAVDIVKNSKDVQVTQSCLVVDLDNVDVIKDTQFSDLTIPTNVDNTDIPGILKKSSEQTYTQIRSNRDNNEASLQMFSQIRSNHGNNEADKTNCLRHMTNDRDELNPIIKNVDRVSECQVVSETQLECNVESIKVNEEYIPVTNVETHKEINITDSAISNQLSTETNVDGKTERRANVHGGSSNNNIVESTSCDEKSEPKVKQPSIFQAYLKRKKNERTSKLSSERINFCHNTNNTNMSLHSIESTRTGFVNVVESGFVKPEYGDDGVEYCDGSTSVNEISKARINTSDKISKQYDVSFDTESNHVTSNKNSKNNSTISVSEISRSNADTIDVDTFNSVTKIDKVMDKINHIHDHDNKIDSIFKVISTKTVDKDNKTCSNANKIDNTLNICENNNSTCNVDNISINSDTNEDLPTCSYVNEIKDEIPTCSYVNEIKNEEMTPPKCIVEIDSKNCVEAPHRTHQTSVVHTDLSKSSYMCPVCYLEQHCKTLGEFNSHIDICLNRDTVKAMVTEQHSTDRKRAEREDTSSKSGSTNKKRRRSGGSKSTPTTSRPISSYFKP